MATEFWKIGAKIFGSYYALIAICVANLQSFLSGMTLAWSSPVDAKLQNHTWDSPFDSAVARDDVATMGSLFSLGGAVAPFIFVYVMERFGRKTTLVLLALPFPVVFLLLAFATNLDVYMVARAVIGISVGASYSLVPVYVAEISPTDLRGTYVSLGTSFVLLGIETTYIVGAYAPLIYYHIFLATFSLIFIPLLIAICPESPYYAMQSQGAQYATEILEKLRKRDVADECKEIEAMVKSGRDGTLKDLLSDPNCLKAFCATTGVLILQQFSGINVLIMNSEFVFAEAGVALAPSVCAIAVGLAQCASGFFAPFAMRSIARKTLFYASFGGLAACNAAMAVFFGYRESFANASWIILPLMAFYICFYTCGVGPLPWVVLGELYPLRVKSVGTALTNSIYMFAQVVLAYYFLKVPLSASFAGFGIAMVIGVFFVKFVLVETKGKSLHEVQNSMAV